MNKSFNNLKMKQKDKITAWVYEEYKKYVTENERVDGYNGFAKRIGLRV